MRFQFWNTLFQEPLRTLELLRYTLPSFDDVPMETKPKEPLPMSCQPMNALLRSIPALMLVTSAHALAASHTQMELAPIDPFSLECHVSTTTYDAPNKQYLAELVVKGYSQIPSVWDSETNSTKDYPNEPLYVFAPYNGSEESTGELAIKVFTRMFAKPMLMNVMLGADPSGTERDVPFEAAIDLVYLSRDATLSAMSRDITVNKLDKACTVSFNAKTKRWTVESR